MDISNGPGTHFTQIQPAVDASRAGDLILVRPGASHFYSGFTIGKGVTVTTTVRGWWIRFTSDINVRGLPSGQRAILKHLGGWYSSSLLLDNNAGTVHIERCQHSFDGGRLVIRNSSKVTLNQVVAIDSRIESSFVTVNRGLSEASFPQDPTLWVSNSIVVLGNTILKGSRANYDMVQCRLLFPPGDAIAGHDSLLILGAGTNIVGGRLAISGGPCPPIFLEASAIRGTNIRVIRDPVTTLGLMTGVVNVQTTPTPTLDGIVGDELAGRMDLDLWARPGSTAALLASLPTDPLLSPLGLQWIDANAHVVVDVGVVDFSGRRRRSFQFPSLVPLGQAMVFQSLVVDAAGIQWSTPSVIVRN